MNKANYDIRLIFSKRLKYLMEEKNLNIKEFSQKIGIPDSTISDWLLKKRTPKIENIPKIATFFNVSTDFLFGLVEF